MKPPIKPLITPPAKSAATPLVDDVFTAGWEENDGDLLGDGVLVAEDDQVDAEASARLTFPMADEFTDSFVSDDGMILGDGIATPAPPATDDRDAGDDTDDE